MKREYSDDVLNVWVDTTFSPQKAEKLKNISPCVRLLAGKPEKNLDEVHVLYADAFSHREDKMPNLKWIQLDSVAFNTDVYRPFSLRGIPIANIRGAYTVAVAEFAVGMMFCLTRRFLKCHTMQQQQCWPVKPEEYPPVQGQNCYNKTIGIIGYGSIGRHIARIANAMNMNVVVCKRSPDNHRDESYMLPNTGDRDGVYPSAWYGIDRIGEMLNNVDVVVITLPQTKETKNLIGASELKCLREGAYIINVGRGSVLDEDALAAHVNAGKIAGVALDVCQNEPPIKNSPLWSMPNLMLTPHIASYTDDQCDLAADVFIDNVRRYLVGDCLINLVDLDAGY